MQNRFVIKILCCLLCMLRCAFGLQRSDITFYAGFQNTIEASISMGGNKPLSYSEHSFQQGITGKGVVAENITYEYRDNINPQEATVSFWMMPAGWNSSELQSGQHNFFRVHGGPAMQITHVYWGVVRFYIYYPRETNTTHAHRYYNFQKDRWYHFAATWKSGEEVQFFINGDLVGRISENVTDIKDGINFSIGAAGTVFDELIIFNRALRQEEVLAIFSGNLR